MALSAGPAVLAQSIVRIAGSGDASPGGAGAGTIAATASGVQASPVLNDAGQSVFIAQLSGVDPNFGGMGNGGANSDRVVLLGAPDGSDVALIRENDPLPDDAAGADVLFSALRTQPSVNNTGQAFLIAQTKSSTTATNAQGLDGLYRVGAGGVVELARVNGAAPGGGFFASSSVNSTPFLQFLPSAVNDAGQAAFGGGFSAASGETVPANITPAIFRADGPTTGTGARIVAAGDAAPTAPGITTAGVFQGLATDFKGGGLTTGSGAFQLAAIDAAGQVAFGSRLGVSATTSLPDAADSGLFIGDGTTLRPLVREGQTAPGGGTFSSDFAPGFTVRPLSLDDAGQAAFASNLTGASFAAGLFVSDGTTITERFRSGTPAPDGNGNLSGNTFGAPNLFETPAINNLGQIAFYSILSNTAFENGAPVPNDRQGIFISNPDGTLTQVIRSGESIPGTSGVFTGPAGAVTPAINELGQLAFLGSFGSAMSLLFFDPALGVIDLVSTGETLDGKTISSLTFIDSSLGTDLGGASGLNDLGQVLFRATFSDNTSGVFLVTVPEPASAATLLAAAGGLALRRRRNG